MCKEINSNKRKGFSKQTNNYRRNEKLKSTKGQRGVALRRNQKGKIETSASDQDGYVDEKLKIHR